MKNKKFLLKAIFIIATLSGCTTHHAHPIYIQNVQNFVREINSSEDFITLKDWLGVLSRQHIVAGSTLPTYASMKLINDNCNRKIYKVTPSWPTPNEFAHSASGDCKGFAICKYYALRRAGFSADQLNLWSGDYNGIPHLILVAKLNNKQFVLDIGAEANLPEAKDYFYKHFQPAYRFNENGWDVN